MKKNLKIQDISDLYVLFNHENLDDNFMYNFSRVSK